MSKLADREAAASAGGLIARWREWWRRTNELGSFDRAELEHNASEFGLSGPDLQDLVAKGPHAADLLYERMAALRLTKPDAERFALGLMRDLQMTCAGCNDKAVCKKDLASRPTDPVWKDYCPNSVTLESIGKTKGRCPI